MRIIIYETKATEYQVDNQGIEKKDLQKHLLMEHWKVDKKYNSAQIVDANNKVVSKMTMIEPPVHSRRNEILNDSVSGRV